MVFVIEAALRSTAAKKAVKWYLGVLEAAERFMVKWHEDEAQLSRQRRKSAVGGAQGNGGRGKEWKETQPRECGEKGQHEE